MYTRGLEHTAIANDIRLEAVFCEALGVVHHAGTAPNVAENEDSHGTNRMLIARPEEDVQRDYPPS